jgi:hypothetical protein
MPFWQDSLLSGCQREKGFDSCQRLFTQLLRIILNLEEERERFTPSQHHPQNQQSEKPRKITHY